MLKGKKRYTQEFKQEAVNLAIKSPSISQTAQELGISIPTLHNWIKSLKQIPTNSKAVSDVSSLLEENRRLHKELLRAQEERDILKKAAAYFAQNQK